LSGKVAARRIAARILLAAAAAALLFWGYHLYLVARLGKGDLHIGTLHDRHALPLYSNWNLNLSLWLLPALLVFGALLLLCRPLFLEPRLGPARTLLVAFALFLLVGFSVCAIDIHRQQDGSWFLPFAYAYKQKALEYWGDVPRVERWGGVQAFLEKYSTSAYFDRLSFHAATHPPGGVLFLWLVTRPFGQSLAAAVIATVAFTGLSLLPLFLLARRLHGEPVARRAVALYLMVPNVVLFTTTSMDGPFSVFPIASLWLFYEAAFARSGARAAWLGVALGAAMALSAFMTYATCLMGLFFGVVATLSFFADRERFRRMAAALAAAVATFAALFVALQLVTGFKPLEALRRSIARDQEGMGTGYESIERFLQIGLCNLLAFLLAAGIPLTVLWLSELRHAVAARPPGAGGVFVAASGAALLIAAFSTLFTAEVERIWLFLVPWLVVPAASRLYEWRRSTGSELPFFTAAILLCAQTVVFEVVLNTRW
jgi:hypothetical protein